MNLNNTLLRTRLGIGFAVVLGLGLLIAGLGVWRLQSTVSQFTLAAANAHEADAAEQWKLMTELNITRAIAVAKSSNHAELDTYFAPQIKATSAQISKLQKELEAALQSEHARGLFAEVGKRREIYLSTRGEIFKQIKAGTIDPQVLDNKLLPLARAYLESLHQFELHHKEVAKAQIEATERAVYRTEILMLALAAICLAIGSVLAWAITRSVTQPLQAALSATREVAHGELTHPISTCGKDEVAGLLSGLEQMRQELGRVVATVRQMSATVQVSSAEIASGSLELSARTEQAAASLQQSAASMEEIAESVRRTAGAAREAATLADTAANSVDRGNKSMEQMHTTMQSISGRAREMSDIITVIDGIAFQTNILALNAAVEAARAGEQGRGFAVVAGEVRTLAQRSGEAAKQIRKLISTSNEEVQDGVMMTEETGRAMQGIRHAIADVARVISEISMMCDQQATAIQEVNTAVTLLDTVTQQNAALVEEASAAATTLSEQADGLVETVAVFKVDENEARRGRRHLELLAA